MEHPNTSHSILDTSKALSQAVKQAEKALQQAGSQFQTWMHSIHTQLSQQQPSHRNSNKLSVFQSRNNGAGMKTVPLDIPAFTATKQPKQTSTSQTAMHQQSLSLSSLPFASINSLPAHMQPANGLQANHNTSDARKAELGRSTWTLLHMLAAQYPEKPTRQQKRDVKQFIDSLTRVYPCGSCASHFSQIVRRSPPNVNSRQELQQWMCRVHNIVNRSIGKPEFNCDVSHHRWEPLDCGPDGLDGASSVSACDMALGTRTKTRR